MKTIAISMLFTWISLYAGAASATSNSSDVASSAWSVIQSTKFEVPGLIEIKVANKPAARLRLRYPASCSGALYYHVYALDTAGDDVSVTYDEFNGQYNPRFETKYFDLGANGLKGLQLLSFDIYGASAANCMVEIAVSK